MLVTLVGFGAWGVIWECFLLLVVYFLFGLIWGSPVYKDKAEFQNFTKGACKSGQLSMRKTLRLSMHSMRLLVVAAAVSASSIRS